MKSRTKTTATDRTMPSRRPNKPRKPVESRTHKPESRPKPQLRAAPPPEARTLLHELATKNGDRAAKVEKVLRKHGKANVSLRQVGELNTGKYRLLPAQPKERQEALVASIERHGIILPIVADEQGNIIAGEFSYEYAKEHRIPCSVLIIRFACEAEKWELALALNPPTRQLDRTERESLIDTYLKKDPQIAPKNLADLIGGTSKNKVAEVQEKLIADGTIPHFDKLRGHDGRYRPATLPPRIIANNPKEIDEALKAISALPPGNGKIMDINTAQRYARRHANKQKRADEVIVPLPNDAIQLHHCRFQDLEIANASAQLLCTDIPYIKGFLPELGDLGAFAQRVLVDGGLLVTYSGQYYLDKVMQSFGEHLTYRWMASSTWNGAGTPIHPRNVVSKWKPILAYSKGDWQKMGMWCDRLHCDIQEKDWHPWQQPLPDVEMLIRYFSKPGDLVVDPCGGAFTTAVACRNLGRRFIGCDVEKKWVDTGHQRLAECQGDTKTTERGQAK